MTIKEILKERMTKKEIALVPSSFEIIGSRDKAVAIVELDRRIRRRSRTIANAIMKKHKNVKSVLLKASPRSGIFRIRNYKIIAGDRNTEVMHIENGCRFLLDPMHVYFSPRESTERQRITEIVKSREIVMVMFAGVGPFAIEIAKKCKPKKVVGIEINPHAVNYFMKNARLNKTECIDILLGDVAEKSKEYVGKCDRVLMPLPERSIEYLGDAIACLKKGGVCHLYCFSREDTLDIIKNRIRNAAEAAGRKIDIIESRKVLPYSPHIWKYRIDFSV